MFIALPFSFLMVIIAVLAAVGLGFVIVLVGAVVCLIGVLIPMSFARKEHKKWVEEGNKEYRYYDPDTGLEVDENGNPLPEGGEVPQNPAPVQEPQIQEPDLPEPDENGDIEEPAPAPVVESAPQPQPQAQPQSQAQPQQRAKYESPFVDFVRTIMPIVGFGLFALVALFRTIMFIRDMVYYIQHNAFFINHILNAIRLIGPAIILAVVIVSMVKYFKEKQSIEKGYVSLLKIAFLSAIIGIVGLVYQGAAFLSDVYNIIDLLVSDGSLPNVFVEMFIRGFITILFYVAFDIALIVFYKNALKNKVDSIKNKIFAVMPFGIMFVICIMFMIVTGVNMPGMAHGFYVTASILMVACAAIGIIPFFVPFKDEPLDQNAAAAAPVKAAPAASVAPAAAPAKQEAKAAPAPQPNNNTNNSGDPEVKSNKKGLIIILIVVAALVLCGGGGVGVYFLIKNNQNNQHREDDEWEDGSSYYSSKSSSSSSRSSSRSSSSSKSSSSSSVSKTPKQVMADICTNIYGSAKYYDDNNSDYNYWYSDAGFITIVGWDSLDESYLQAAAEFAVEKLPNYLVNIDSLHSGTWSDGLSGYFQNFTTQDEQVMVEVGSYYDETGLNCQILSHFNY